MKMHPAFWVVVLTSLTGAAQGLFLALYLVDVFYGMNEESFLVSGAAVAAVLAALGLFAFPFRVGRLKLPREVILLSAFIAGCFAYGASHYLDSSWVGWIAFLTFLACMALFVCRGFALMSDLFVGSASGFTLATVLAALIAPSWVRFYAHAAIALTLVALGLRVASLVRSEQARTVKWALLLLAFVVPVLLLASELESGSVGVLTAAVVVQFIGLIAQRWYIA
jgi:sulfite dehydrogenase (quinone) subunit SoeC